MGQCQASFFPAYLPGLSPIHPGLRLRLARGHHRQHAAIHFHNQQRHTRTLRSMALVFLHRQHRSPMLLGHHPHRTHRNLNPIMFFQLGRGPGKGIIRTQIRDGSLQTFRISTALHLCGLAKGSDLRSPPAVGEDLLFYGNGSQPRVPVETFFSLRFMPGLRWYSSSFFCCCRRPQLCKASFPMRRNSSKIRRSASAAFSTSPPAFSIMPSIASILVFSSGYSFSRSSKRGCWLGQVCSLSEKRSVMGAPRKMDSPMLIYLTRQEMFSLNCCKNLGSHLPRHCPSGV